MIGIFQIDLLSLSGGELAGIEDANVTVRKESDGTLATLYSDEEETGKSNPFVTDGTNLEFFADDGERYSIEISKGAFSRTLEERAVTTRPLPAGDLATEEYVDDALKNVVLRDQPTEFTAQQNFGEVQLTDAASIVWDLSAAQTARVTLTDDRALANPTNMVGGGTYILRVIQDGSGGHTLSFGSAYRFPGGAPPVLTTTADAVDILTFYSDGSAMYCIASLDFQPEPS